MDRVLRDWKAIVIFVGPALLVYVLVLLVPIGWSFGYTVFQGSPIAGFRFSGLKNYLKLFHDQELLSSILFGLKYAAVVSGGQILFGLMMALVYFLYLKPSSSVIRTIVFLPIVLPSVAVAQMFVKLFAVAPQYGLVNQILAAIGGNSWTHAWLGHGTSAFWVLAVMDIWRAIGFYAILLFTGLVEIPSELIESARLDGARTLQLVRNIIGPLILPLVVTALIFSLNGTLKVFDAVLALTNGGPGTSTTPLTLYMYMTSFSYNEYGYGSTLAVVLALESLLVTALVYRFARRSAV